MVTASSASLASVTLASAILVVVTLASKIFTAVTASSASLASVTLASAIFTAVTTLLFIVSVPVLVKEASPFKSTARAFSLEFPTKI